jgi:glycosyltransferase involved in cell wall biosynthesis
LWAIFLKPPFGERTIAVSLAGIARATGVASESVDNVRPDNGNEDVCCAAMRTPVSIVVPCCDEEDAIPHLADTLESVESRLGGRYELSFVFVDDGSRDNTWQCLQAAFGTKPNCHVLQHERNRGVAAAIRTGIEAAGSRIVCSIDSDCTYDPHDLERMLPLMTDGVDLVTASPYHPAGAVEDVPGWRLALSKGLSRLYRCVSGEPVHTFTSCFRTYRKSAVERLPQCEDGFLGVAELLLKLSLAGGRIVEFPTTLRSRRHGYSKLKVGRTILAHLRMLAVLSLLRLVGPRRRAKRCAHTEYLPAPIHR